MAYNCMIPFILQIVIRVFIFLVPSGKPKHIKKCFQNNIFKSTRKMIFSFENQIIQHKEPTTFINDLVIALFYFQS